MCVGNGLWQPYQARCHSLVAAAAALPHLHCLLLQESLPLLQLLIVCVPQDGFSLPQPPGSCVARRCQRIPLLPQALQLCSLLRHCALAAPDLVVCEGRVDKPQLHREQQNRTGVRQAVSPCLALAKPSNGCCSTGRRTGRQAVQSATFKVPKCRRQESRLTELKGGHSNPVSKAGTHQDCLCVSLNRLQLCVKLRDLTLGLHQLFRRCSMSLARLCKVDRWCWLCTSWPGPCTTACRPAAFSACSNKHSRRRSPVSSQDTQSCAGAQTAGHPMSHSSNFRECTAVCLYAATSPLLLARDPGRCSCFGAAKPVLMPSISSSVCSWFRCASSPSRSLCFANSFACSAVTSSDTTWYASFQCRFFPRCGMHTHTGQGRTRCPS